MINRPPVIGDLCVDADHRPYGYIWIVTDVDNYDVSLRLLSEIHGRSRKVWKNSSYKDKMSHVDFANRFSLDVKAMIHNEITSEYADLEPFGLKVGIIK